MSSFDLDIEHYTIPELYQMFKLDKKATERDVMRYMNKIIKNMNDKENDEYLLFIRKVENKLVDYIQNKTKRRLTPSNTLDVQQQTIIQKQQPVQYTYEYPFPAGNINPLEKRTIKRVLCLDTIYRDNYYASNSNNILWKLPYVFKNVVSMKLISCQLPIQYYMFSSANKNNTFTVNLYNMLKNGTTFYPNTSIQVVIPDGNYTLESFIVSMNNYLNNKKEGLEYICIDVNYINAKLVLRTKNKTDIVNNVVAYDASNNYYSPDFYFEVDFGKILPHNTYLNAGFMMGFNQPFYKVVRTDSYMNDIALNSIFFEGIVYAEMIFGNTVLNYVFIDVDDFNNNYITNTITSLRRNNSYLGNNILARITVTSSPNSVIDDNGSDRIYKEREYLGPVDIEKLKIRILDRDGNLIDLENNNYSLSFEFTILYS
jgi:succinate dehydrogenase flavin-adding protein (antitoxin of CptAB toxin-antitoxin module)